MDELIEAGNKDLVLAAENFDESRGFKFIPYAIWWVRQSIEKEIENSNNLE
jgi:RNA polymerase primary sigma factor